MKNQKQAGNGRSARNLPVGESSTIGRGLGMAKGAIRSTGHLGPLGLILLPVAVVCVSLFSLLASGPAQASPSIAGFNTSCPTYAYTGSTIAPCTTSTTSSSSTTSGPGGTTPTTAGTSPGVTLIVSYSDGVLRWQACGFPSSDVGTTVQLYVGGSPVTESG